MATKTKLSWDERYEELRAFYVKHGHINVPASPGSKQFALYCWLRFQRRQNQKLEPSKLAKLEKLGFSKLEKGMSKELKNRWMERFRQYKRYVATFGGGDGKEVKITDQQLCAWVSKQRKDKRANKLSPEREANLRAVGFDFKADKPPKRSAKISHEELWNQRYLEVKELYEKMDYHAVHNGDCRAWARHQRVLKKEGRMRADREKKLNDIGFKWA